MFYLTGKFCKKFAEISSLSPAPHALLPRPARCPLKSSQPVAFIKCLHPNNYSVYSVSSCVTVHHTRSRTARTLPSSCPEQASLISLIFSLLLLPSASVSSCKVPQPPHIKHIPSKIISCPGVAHLLIMPTPACSHVPLLLPSPVSLFPSSASVLCFFCTE